MTVPRNLPLRSIRPGRPAILLSALWFLAAVSAIGPFFSRWPGWNFLVGASSFVFILGLIGALAQAKPAAADLPTPDVFPAQRTGFWSRSLLLLFGLGMLFFLGLMFGVGFVIMLACGLIGLWITIARRNRLTRRLVGFSLLAGLVSGLGQAFLGEGDLSWTAAYLLTIPPAFTGGALLLRRTQIGHLRWLEGKPVLAVKGFLFGCVLAVPGALLNQLGNLSGQDNWVTHGWQPLYAVVPAVAEETWARLLIIPFCYAVMWPVTSQRPRRALLVAILISTVAWGFAHTGFNLAGLILGSLLFGLPEALLLVKKDFEHAVGYHFLIDFVRYLAAFLA